MPDPSVVGPDKKFADITEEYDSSKGSYKDTVISTPTEQRLPTADMPKGPDPSPYKNTKKAAGGR